jgi:hypothetical protein
MNRLFCLGLIGFIAISLGSMVPVQDRMISIPKSPYDWDWTGIDGRKWKTVSVCFESKKLPTEYCTDVRGWPFEWPDGIPTEQCHIHAPQLTYSVKKLRQEFDRPIYLTAWLMPSLLINKKASWERYKDFIDDMVKLDGPNSLRAFSAGVWERNTVDEVRFPFLKVKTPNGWKFDLEQVNPEWLDETLRRIEYFVSRGGTFIYTLIDKCSTYPNRNGWWKFHWWNGNNNVNGTHIEPKAIRHMYNWSTRSIPGAKETKYYVLKFMTDMVELLEERFPDSIVYDFNEFNAEAYWYLNVDRDVFRKFNIPKHRKMFSMVHAHGGFPFGEVAQIMPKYIWQPHGICNLTEYNRIAPPAAGLIHPSADGCWPSVPAEEMKWIVFNSLMDGRAGFENNRAWHDDWINNENNYWRQADWNIAKGMKDGFLMWYNAHK